MPFCCPVFAGRNDRCHTLIFNLFDDRTLKNPDPALLYMSAYCLDGAIKLEDLSRLCQFCQSPH